MTSSSGGSMTLSAIGYKVKGLQKVDLNWNGPPSTNFHIYRNGSKITSTANDGYYTDNINKRGNTGSYTYKVCEQGTSTCSNDAPVTSFK